jgi:hypothetical protein
MGLIGKILGLGRNVERISGAVERVTEIFVPNRTKSEDHSHRRAMASLEQLAAEFKLTPTGWFDGFVNGLNRLPRPILALGTVGLFAYAMTDPIGFSVRMRGLDTVPDPLWWLLGAIVSFYFGAREMHYMRGGKKARDVRPEPLGVIPRHVRAKNAALDEWYHNSR